MGDSISGKSRATITRATRSQLAILRRAYGQFISPSSEQKKWLSQETGLPSKWISQWFCRQRNRDRRNICDRPATVDLKTTSPSSSEPEPVEESILTITSLSKGSATIHQANKKIKLECLDAASDLQHALAGPSTEPITVGPTLQTSVVNDDRVADDSDNALLLFSSANKGTKPVAQQNKAFTRSMAKAKATVLETTPSRAGITDVATPVEPSDDLGLEKTTHGDLSAFLADRHLASMSAYTQHPTAVAVSIAKVDKSCFADVIPSTWRASPLLRNDDKSGVRNPSRLSVVSLPAAAAAAASRDPGYQQSLSSQVVPVSGQDWSRLAQRAVAAYQRGQVFRTHWPNDASSGTHSQFSQATISQKMSAPLTDAGVSNQDPNFNMTVGASSSIHPSGVVHSLMSASSAVFMANLDFSGSRLTEGDISFMNALQTVAMTNDPQQHMKATSGPEAPASNLYEQLDVLDPSYAPLKYLTGVLANFKSEDGSYGRLLVDEEIRRKVVDCLSNEDLFLSNPFVGAMGLSLLSRLGLL